MNTMIVNGIERPLPLDRTRGFEELMQYVRQHYVSESSLIASIKVNGREMGESDERNLGGVPLADLESFEVSFAHPRELAEDTLQTLKLFCDRLADLSLRAADRVETDKSENDFRKLIDGIETLSETLSGVKSLLRIGLLEPVALLEADLLSILRDLLMAHEKKDTAYRVQLLREHLPRNLEQWALDGIPALIRSRDS